MYILALLPCVKNVGIRLTNWQIWLESHKVFLREIELGLKKPGIDTLSYICDALHISMRDFFDDEELSKKEDELMQEINKLTMSQRCALLKFLKTLS